MMPIACTHFRAIAIRRLRKEIELNDLKKKKEETLFGPTFM